ncbi:MAG: glycosyltransferase [Treponema sp.]|nr:glycosyltransferase [Treponema sp.]
MLKFSIIIPVYNASKYLNRCIDSCLNQNYSNIEVICVDDFSKDNSKEILENYKNKDNRIKCIYHSKNESQYIARRNGFLESTGDYIMFIDSDDTLIKNACKLIIKKINITKADIIQYGYKEIPSNKKIFSPFYNSSNERIKNYLALEKRYSPEVWTKAYKRSILEKSFNAMEVFYASGPEDVYSSIVFAHFSNTFCLLKKALVNYYIYTGWSARKEYSIDILTSWLASYSVIIEKTRNFINKYIPELSKNCSDMEVFLLRDFLYNRLPSDLNPELKKQFFDILPSYFSKETINLLMDEFLSKSKKHDKYINFNSSFISNSKKITLAVLLYIKSIFKK